MNNHEHFEIRSIALETNYHNEHSEYLGSEPIDLQIEKMSVWGMFMKFRGMFIKCS